MAPDGVERVGVADVAADRVEAARRHPHGQRKDAAHQHRRRQHRDAGEHELADQDRVDAEAGRLQQPGEDVRELVGDQVGQRRPRRRSPRCSAAEPADRVRACAGATRANTAAPTPRPIRNASRMSVNEKIDEPSRIASARVHSTCSVIAVAPETANAASATRRARGVDHGRAAAAPPPRACASTAATSRRSLGAARRASSAAGRRRRATRIAAASVRLKAAAVTLVQRTPSSGRNTKPAKNVPATAPNRLTA